MQTDLELLNRTELNRTNLALMDETCYKYSIIIMYANQLGWRCVLVSLAGRLIAACNVIGERSIKKC